jgi:hypothetical protein
LLACGFHEGVNPASSVVSAGASFGGASNQRVRRQTPVIDQFRE